MTKDILQTSALLLEHGKETIKRFDESYKQSGGKYNVFKIANISTDEVKTCKIIGDLLDTNGCHCKGDYFLKHFIEILNENAHSSIIVTFGSDKLLILLSENAVPPIFIKLFPTIPIT